MHALYLLDSDRIASGSKTAIAAKSRLNLSGLHALIVKRPDGSYIVTGTVSIGVPETVDVSEFDARVEEHKVTRKQRLTWWPDAEQLVLYPLTYLASDPQEISVAPGLGMQVELQGLGLKEIAVEEPYYIYEVE